MKMALFLGLAALAVPAAAQHSGHAAPPAAAAAVERPAQASGENERAVLAVVDRMFAALAALDSAALLAEVVPEGRATANLLGPDRLVRSAAWPSFAARLAEGHGRLAERLIDPHVHIEGDIAMIWSRYEFEIDGRFSHCGIDHFDLVRQDGRWRVLNLTWTQQAQGCPGR
jgi:hypothetical protein